MMHFQGQSTWLGACVKATCRLLLGWSANGQISDKYQYYGQQASPMTRPLAHPVQENRLLA